MEAEEAQAHSGRAQGRPYKLSRTRGQSLMPKLYCSLLHVNQLDREHADAKRVRKEADELWSKVSTLEREQDELKSRTESSTGG